MKGGFVMDKLLVRSAQFEENGWIPDCCASYGEDKSPELIIEGIPEGTAALAVVLDDLGHPIHPGFNHWTAWNISPSGIIPANLPKGAVLDEPIHIEQGIAWGKHCYRGPKPPFNWNHTYRFTVFALSKTIELSPDSGKAELLAAIEGLVLAKGELFGKYQRKHR